MHGQTSAVNGTVTQSAPALNEFTTLLPESKIGSQHPSGETTPLIAGTGGRENVSNNDKGKLIELGGDEAEGLGKQKEQDGKSNYGATLISSPKGL